MSKRQSPIDWTGGHTPAWAAINGAGISAVTATAGYLAHAPLWIGPAEGAAGAIAAAAVATRRRFSPGHRVYRAATWLVAGGWTSWAMETGPWSSWWPATALIAGATLAWGCSAAYEAWEEEAPARRAAAEAQAQREKTGDAWEERLERVCRVAGCHVIGVEEWETGKGYSIEVELPGGTTVDAIASQAMALRSDLRLPRGCTLEVDQGEDYGVIVIRVNTVDGIAQLIPFPEDLSRTSINNPFSLGEFRDGEKSLASLRFHCGLIIGQPEGGKTNLLNVINASLGRCDDVLIWHIDTTGAGITLPWLRSWAREGTASKPVVDWSASTVDEALLMLCVAEEIIAVRKRDYQDLMYAVNDDKVPVDHTRPEIIIIADEVAQLPQPVQDGINAVINTGRASGVRAVNSALRGTRDMVSASMKEMTRLRIAMRVSDESEYHQIFNDPRGLKKADAAVQGSGFFEYDNSAVQAFKAYRLEPKDIARISQVVAGYRPVMDEISLGIPSADVYRTRWERTLPQLYKPGTPLSPAAQEILDRAPAVPTPTIISTESAAPAPGKGDGLDALRAMLFPVSGGDPQPPAEPADAAPAPAPMADPAIGRAFGQVLDDATWHLAPETVDLPQPPALGVVPPTDITDPVQLRTLELIDASGPDGRGASALVRELTAEGTTRDRGTVQRWLTTWAASGLIVRQSRDGGQVAYIRPWHDQPQRHSA
ncbi:hypothetical protein [Kitasatospora sp. GP82]|uniref:hypothetical protein n=1 Tax=Kitasatospora sp. GP82 TaxID=3035089 RepID=UPI002473374F|nr:hypothetical protein [Kitasatospora sp. GP82]MDH6130371.1 hypothetical protein [Kitasatospora sp. GP82]